MFLLRLVWAVVNALFAKKADLVAENLALCQQLIVFRRKVGRPRLRRRDRIFWLWLARSWDGWRDTLIVVKPATVVRWHRQGFEHYWAWKSRHKGGRPAIDPEVRDLIRRMSRANSLWGYSRIQGALDNLGHRVGRTTIVSILKQHGIEPAPERGKRVTWSQFLKAHWSVLAAADFFTVEVWGPRGLVTFHVFVVIELATRRVEIAGITPGPNEAWMMQVG